MSDTVLNKKSSIERCILQIRKYYALPGDGPFETDHFKQDAIAVNMQRACQLSIDLANHTIRKKRLGLPKDSGNSFELLAEAGIIDLAMCDKLKGMVGFRNILVHAYRSLDLELMKDIIENHLDELIEFAQVILLEFPD